MPDIVLSYEAALAQVVRHAAGLGSPAATETLELLETAGRTLAVPVHADRDQPPFDRSTRDGYAVRAGDLGQPLKLVGTLRAGEVWQGAPLAAGQAIEIMTGAPVPAGTDAVLMVEHAALTLAPAAWATAPAALTSAPAALTSAPAALTLEPAALAGATLIAQQGRTLRAGDNLVPRASEARAGQTLLPAGRRIAAAEIAVAASCGCSTLEVFAQPHVAILATGDELVTLDAAMEPQQIRNSNSYALAALVRAAGAQPHRLPIARDTREDLVERIAQGRAHDLLLLSGGVSMGKYDLVEDVLTELGAEFLFTGALIQPGKPVVFGRMPKRATPPASQPEPQSVTAATESPAVSPAESPAVSPAESPAVSPAESLAVRPAESPAESPADRPANPCSDAPAYTYFFGLPGNPISTQVCFHLFVAPLLGALCGRSGDLAPQFVEARLAEDVKGGAKVTRFLPAELSSDVTQATVKPTGWQGSGDLAANARGNAYVVLPAEMGSFAAGDTVRVLLR